MQQVTTKLPKAIWDVKHNNARLKIIQGKPINIISIETEALYGVGDGNKSLLFVDKLEADHYVNSEFNMQDCEGFGCPVCQEHSLWAYEERLGI